MAAVWTMHAQPAIRVDRARCCLLRSQGWPGAVLLLSPRTLTAMPAHLRARTVPALLYNASVTRAGGAVTGGQSQASPGTPTPAPASWGSAHPRTSPLPNGRPPVLLLSGRGLGQAHGCRHGGGGGGCLAAAMCVQAEREHGPRGIPRCSPGQCGKGQRQTHTST